MLSFKEFITESHNASVDELVDSPMDSHHHMALEHPDLTSAHIGKILSKSRNNSVQRKAVNHPYATKEHITGYLDSFKHPYYHDKIMDFSDIRSHKNAPLDHEVLVKHGDAMKKRDEGYRKNQEEMIAKNRDSHEKALKAWHKLSPEEKEKIHGDHIQKTYYSGASGSYTGD